MKIFSTLLLSFCLLFSSTVTPAFASTTDITGVATSIYQLYLENDASGKLSLASDVSGYKIGDAEEFIYEALEIAINLLPFSLNAEIDFSHEEPATFEVKFQGRNLQDHNREAISKINSLVAEAQKLSSAIDRVKFINDYLVDNCSYCLQAINEPDRYENAFTIYGCLIEGSAVCEGYANTIMLFCEKLNIPCIKVTGTANGSSHVWNSVYLNDRWWMLDTTFNDPLGSQEYNDRFEYFLLDIDTFNEKKTHTYDSHQFELSKKIITGRTEGQYEAVPFYYYNLLNATADDKLPSFSTIISEVEKESFSSLTTEEKAQWLHEQNLFFGDENGFRLTDPLNRVEMGIMMMRLNKGQATVKNNAEYFREQCPFLDVPDWAQAAFGYLYSQKLIAGQSANSLGTGQVCLQDYAVILLRVLDIEHTYENAVIVAAQHGILTSSQIDGKTPATRGDIVDMTYAAVQLLNN